MGTTLKNFVQDGNFLVGRKFKLNAFHMNTENVQWCFLPNAILVVKRVLRSMDRLMLQSFHFLTPFGWKPNISIAGREESPYGYT